MQQNLPLGEGGFKFGQLWTNLKTDEGLRTLKMADKNVVIQLLLTSKLGTASRAALIRPERGTFPWGKVFFILPHHPM